MEQVGRDWLWRHVLRVMPEEVHVCRKTLNDFLRFSRFWSYDPGQTESLDRAP